MTYLSLLCTQPRSRFVRLSCLNISKTYLEPVLCSTLSPLTMVQLWEWSLLPLAEGSSKLCLHSIQEKCDTCIKPLVVPAAQLTRTLRGSEFGLSSSPPSNVWPCPCSSHHLWLLPSLLRHWFRDGYWVSGYWPWQRSPWRTNVCLDCWMSIALVPDPGGTKMNQRKSLLPDRSSQSGEWTRSCTRRIFTIWCDRCDPEGKSTSGARRSSGNVSREEVFEVSWWTSTEI